MTRPPMRPLGAQISHMLKDRGVTHIFGIPGVHNQEMYRGIEEAGITHILARNEQGAGFMADGYARATGKPGVAYVITGPGLCNIMNPMGQAYSDSVSMLVISSCLDETAARKGQLHQMNDQEAAAATVTDWSYTAQTPQAAYELIDRALTEFQTSRPRPKHIQVPIAKLMAEAEPHPKPPASITFDGPNSNQLEKIAELLAQASRPIIVFGGGAKRIGTLGTQLSNATQAAVFTTYAGRGIVSLDTPNLYGTFLSRPESEGVFADADLILAIGTELSECDLWRDHLGHSGTLIRVDLDPSVFADRQRSDYPVLSDATVFCEALLQLIKSNSATWNPAVIADTKHRWRAQSDAERTGIAPLVDALHEAAPDDTMFFSDMTQFAYVANEIYPMARPNHWHHPSGFGTLGYALAAGIGGKIGRPNQPVISINGDSGFQYNIQELATAVELGLTLPIIVWDNGKLKEIEDSMTRAQIAPNAVIARNPDFCKLAEAYGANSAAPRSIEAFKLAINDALNAQGPTLIHVTPETSAN
jgi:5-guanidino-2-oxopentanoate decarboxylase